MATAYQKRMMLRKQSDLTRIADQYKKNIEAMTGQYESEFASWQKQRDELMAPYEAAVKQYKEVQMPAFEAAKSEYESRLNAFNQAMSDWEANPKEQVNAKISSSRGGPAYTIDGKTYYGSTLPSQYTVEGSINNIKTLKVYKDRPMPTMSGSAPTAPAAPTAPTIPAFDTTQFEQQKTELQTGFQREVGERKGARLAAVGRRTSRPLLQGQ